MPIADECKPHAVAYTPRDATQQVPLPQTQSIFNRRTGKNAALTSLQHLIIPPVLSSAALKFHHRFFSSRPSWT